MKILKKILIAIVLLTILSVLVLYVTGNSHILNGITKTYMVGESRPDIDDMDYFDLRKIDSGEQQPWPVSNEYNQREISQPLLDSVEAYETTAFLVIKNDSIYFEQYWEGYTDTTYSNSFSMAKSFTSVLIGCAIADGKIESAHQKVSDFLPRFSEGQAAGLEIEHLLQMRSNIPFGESYSSPFGYMARAYYGSDLRAETNNFTVEGEPGAMWEYEGGNTVLLAMILEEATGKNISEYFSEKVWKPIGARKPAYWNLDREDGLEKAFSAVYSNPRDFARIGKLYLDSGNWDGLQIVPEEYVTCSLEPVMVEDRHGKPVDWYGYQWWLGSYGNKPFFSARGMRGQYILAVPQDDLIVVRLGHARSKRKMNNAHVDVYQFLDIAYDMTCKR